MVNCLNSQNCARQSKTTMMACEILSAPHLKAFSFKDLKTATNNFRSDNGERGVGNVYKGWLDEQTLRPSKSGVGTMVAIKRMKPIEVQDYKEWLTEVAYLGKLHHPNLVKLIGYCSEKEYLHLVYEFTPKGSFEDHLFRSGAAPLPWQLRLNVVIGAAKGLSFLHSKDPQVFYSYFKGSNILLDSDYNAKLSDFGFQEPSDHTICVSFSDSPGPDVTKGPSAKADVYKFGVVLLELLTGRQALDKSRPVEIERDLVTWARTCLGDEQKLYGIMDPKLEGQYPKRGARAVFNLALRCVTDERKSRPKMSEVLEILSMI